MAYLCDIEDLFALIGGTADPTDVRALLALEGASGVVRKFTGQTFDLVEDDDVTLDGRGTYDLVLPQLPVLSITTIETLDAEDVATDVTTYRYNAAGVVHRLDAVWPIGFGNIVVTYDHGYILPGETGVTLPDDIRSTTAQIAARLYSLSSAGGTVTSETIGSYSYTADAAESASSSTVPGLTDTEALVLTRYRTPPIA